MFKLLSFFYIYICFFYFLAFEFMNVKFILQTSTSVSPSVVGCCCGSAILDFQKFEILTVYLTYWANVRHLAKFHQNGSNGCGDMAI